MALSRRKKQIMKIVVDSYINTAEPVGSKAIADQLPEKVSSATVRKDLADLVGHGLSGAAPYLGRVVSRPPRATGCMSTS